MNLKKFQTKAIDRLIFFIQENYNDENLISDNRINQWKQLKDIL